MTLQQAGTDVDVGDVGGVLFVSLGQWKGVARFGCAKVSSGGVGDDFNRAKSRECVGSRLGGAGDGAKLVDAAGFDLFRLGDGAGLFWAVADVHNCNPTSHYKKVVLGISFV